MSIDISTRVSAEYRSSVGRRIGRYRSTCRLNVGRVSVEFWLIIEYLSSKRSLYRPIISLSSSAVNCDGIGSVSAMYRWTVGRVSVTYRWYIGRVSAPPVQLWQTTDMLTESWPTYRLTPPIRHKIQSLRCFGSQTSSWETVVTKLQPAYLETCRK